MLNGRYFTPRRVPVYDEFAMPLVVRFISNFRANRQAGFLFV